MSLFDELKQKNNDENNIVSNMTQYYFGFEDNFFCIKQNDNELIINTYLPNEVTYILEDKNKNSVKIGKTKRNPLKRLQELQTSNYDLQLIIFFPKETYDEKTLHEKFKQYKVVTNSSANEWFFKTQEIVDFIKEETEKLKKYTNIINTLKNIWKI